MLLFSRFVMEIMTSYKLNGVSEKVFHLVYCLGEANSKILEYLQAHNNACGILSRDSDIAITAGFKLFLPDLFDLNHDLGICSNCINEYPEDTVCEVVTPARVANALNLRETQLADLSVLCG